MNERAVELYKQAVTFAYNTAGKDAGKGTVIESLTAGKFAELIVRECIAKAEEESERYLTWNTEDCNRFSKVMQNYKELLKEHFGVEE